MPGSMNFLLNICGYVCVCTSCYTCSFKYREVRKQLVELVRQLCGSLRLNIGWLAGGKHLYPLRYVPSPLLLTFSIAAFNNCTVSLEGWPCACYKKQLCSAACASVAGIAVQVSGSTRLPLLSVSVSSEGLLCCLSQSSCAPYSVHILPHSGSWVQFPMVSHISNWLAWSGLCS